jgi:hypothetical protein
MKNFNEQPLANCERKDDLVSFLYDELPAPERAQFEGHLNDCASCRDESRAFGRVREELSTWQVGFAPRTEVVLPRRKMDVLRELISLFPVWVRGAAVASAAAALVLMALALTDARINFKQGEIAFGQKAASSPSITTSTAASTAEIETMVQNAVAKERARLQADFQAQAASLKQELNVDYQAQLAAATAAQEARFKATQAALKAEIRKANQQNQQGASIRSFFAANDNADPLGDTR